MTDITKLASEGGVPVRERLLPYTQHVLDESDIQEVSETLRTPFLTQGPMIAKFEEAMRAYTGAKYAIAYSTGTSALHAAAHVAGIKAGDNAVTSPFTFAASANCIRYEGGSVRFVDIWKDTLNLNETLLDKSTDSKTKAVVAVDYGGHPCEYDLLRTFCKNHRLTLIADAAHSLGATYKGKKVGTLADLTTLSFHPAKLITTGEGGMVLTNDESAYRELLTFRHHGIEKEKDRLPAESGGWIYEMRSLGNNYRITDFQCALGLSQLRKANQFIARRREIAAKYTQHFKSIDAIHTTTVRVGIESAWHIYPIRFDLTKLSADRKKLFNDYRAENIGVQVHYIPVYHHPYYMAQNRASTDDFPITEATYSHILTLPLFPAMTERDIQDVLNATDKIVSHNLRN